MGGKKEQLFFKWNLRRISTPLGIINSRTPLWQNSDPEQNVKVCRKITTIKREKKIRAQNSGLVSSPWKKNFAFSLSSFPLYSALSFVENVEQCVKLSEREKISEWFSFGIGRLCLGAWISCVFYSERWWVICC